MYNLNALKSNYQTDYSFINLENPDDIAHMKTWCESTCGESQWDQGIDDYTPPCDEDIIDFWVSALINDDDHHDENHHDDHHDDHHEENSPWEWIFPDEVYY